MKQEITAFLDASGALHLVPAPEGAPRYRVRFADGDLVVDAAVNQGAFEPLRGEMSVPAWAHRFARPPHPHRQFFGPLLPGFALRFIADIPTFNLGALRLALQPSGLELMRRAPALFVVVAARLSREASARPALPFLARKRRELLTWALGAEADVGESRVTLLAKVGVHRAVKRADPLGDIVRLAGDEAVGRALRHLPCLPLVVVDLALKHREHVVARASWMLRALETIARHALPAAAAASRDRIRAELAAERSIARVVAAWERAARVLRETDVSVEILRDAQDTVHLLRIAERAASRCVAHAPFPEPPLPAWDDDEGGSIRPIRSALELHRESLALRNCAFGLLDQVKAGAVALYRVVGPPPRREQAMAEVQIHGVGFRVHGDRIELLPRRLSLGQVLGAGNEAVPETAAWVRAWFDREVARRGRVGRDEAP